MRLKAWCRWWNYFVSHYQLWLQLPLTLIIEI
jgi:hypothetical protein